ncbi:MAG: DUF835 domain-containing protein, partial [Vulcanimicrobiota bacterium]
MKNSFNLLLVEDNPEHLSFQKKSIEKLDNIDKVFTAKSSKDALELLSKNNIHLMVLDYDLPDSDGLSFLETISDKTISMAVVMVTGLGNEKVAVKAMKLGAYDYVVKDRSLLKKLPDVIRRSLDKYRLSQSLMKMEQQLRESRERFKELYENANSGFISVDMKTGLFIRPNKKFEEITGFTAEEISTMKYYNLPVESEKDRFVSYYNNWIKGLVDEKKAPTDFEMKIRIKNNRECYAKCMVSIMPRINEMFITLNDVTERKALEEKLKKANEQLKSYTKNLEKKVDELEKSLIIEPALEHPTDSARKYKLDFGCSYLVCEERPAKSYEVFKDMVSHGIFGLIITRTYPGRIQQLYHLEKTPVVWLSKNKEETSSIPGANLGSLLYTISEFMEKSKESVIILDGLEYLITVNEFNRCIQFLYDLFEIIMVNKAVLIIPMNSEAV